MALLYLSKEELMCLSSYSRIKPDKLSPINRLYIEEVVDFNKERMEEAANEFFANNYIVRRGENELVLAKELEPAFFILHKPERVLAFRRIGMTGIDEIYFCYRSGFWLQFTIHADRLVQILEYPYSLEMIKDWFKNNYLKDISFENQDMSSNEYFLSTDETLVMFIMQNIYRDRIMSKKDSLSPEEMWINSKFLANYKKEDLLVGAINLIVTEEKLKEYLSNEQAINNSISGLVKKSMLVSGQNGIAFSNVSKHLFNHGNVRDCVVLKNVSENDSNVSFLNITDNGYLLFSCNKEEGGYHISKLSTSTDLKEIFNLLSKLDEKKLIEELNKKQAQQKATVNEKRFCTKCGAPLNQEAKFCSKCGNKT